MNSIQDEEIKNYIENPDALIILCESVLNELLAPINDKELEEKKAQLSEVSRSIDKLTKLSIGIPDELRDLKISLLTDVETQLKTKNKVENVVARLKEMIKIIESDYFTEPQKKKRTRKWYPKSNLPRTKKEDYRPEIISALKALGGSGTNKEVIAIIEERVKDKLLPGDFEETSRGTPIWINNIHWERNTMREEGIIRGDSPRGMWELNEEYK